MLSTTCYFASDIRYVLFLRHPSGDRRVGWVFAAGLLLVLDTFVNLFSAEPDNYHRSYTH